MTPVHFSFLRFLKRHLGILVFYFFAPMSLCFGQACPSTILFTQINPACPNVDNGKITLTVLNSEGQNITTNDELIFLWSSGQDSTASQIMDLAPGNYSVTVVNSNPNQTCDFQPFVTVNILDPSILEIEFCQELSPSQTVGGETGIGEVFFSGGKPPYTISWSGPVSGSTQQDNLGSVQIPNLKAGVYATTVSDACNSTNSCTITITEPDCDYLTNDEEPVITNPSCFGEQDGQADFTQLIGNSNNIPGIISFNWLNDGFITNDPIRPGLAAQNYAVVIQDNITRCRDTVAMTVSNPSLITIQNIVITHDGAENGGQGQIKFSISGGTPPYRVNWSGGLGATTGSQTNVQPGEFPSMVGLLHSPAYTVTVKDQEDCEASVGGLRVDRIMRIKRNTQVAIKFPPDMDDDERCQYLKSIVPNFDCTRQPERECYCKNGADSIVFITTGNTEISLNSTPQVTQTTVKSDTSGVGKTLISPAMRSTNAAEADCTYSSTNNSILIKTHPVRVAIIDSGIKVDHRRLKGKVWINGRETEGDGKDDDGNCLVDDRSGYDYPNQAHVVVDEVGHGTHVAGIIADAFPDNVDLQLINLKVYANRESNSTKRSGDAIDVACAIYYAIDKSAQIINLSLGYFNKEPSIMLYDALKLAEQRGILVVISSGNEATNIDNNLLTNRWPASFKNDSESQTEGILPGLKNLIVVGAADDSGKALAKSYSNWGPGLVDILAPGNITSAFIGAEEEKALEGTSMSAAYITHVAAIAKAYEPKMSPREFINKLLKEGSDIVNELDTIVGCSCVVNKDKLFQAMDLGTQTTPVTVQGVPVPPRPSITIPVAFPTGGINVPFGNGGIFYRDVELIIAGGFELAPSGSPRQYVPNNVFYRKLFCDTDRIIWNGLGNNNAPWRGRRDPQNIQRFVMVYIGNERIYGPQPIRKQ